MQVALHYASSKIMKPSQIDPQFAQLQSRTRHAFWINSNKENPKCSTVWTISPIS